MAFGTTIDSHGWSDINTTPEVADNSSPITVPNTDLSDGFHFKYTFHTRARAVEIRLKYDTVAVPAVDPVLEVFGQIERPVNDEWVRVFEQGKTSLTMTMLTSVNDLNDGTDIFSDSIILNIASVKLIAVGVSTAFTVSSGSTADSCIQARWMI